jgi:hypothetical protein
MQLCRQFREEVPIPIQTLSQRVQETIKQLGGSVSDYKFLLKEWQRQVGSQAPEQAVASLDLNLFDSASEIREILSGPLDRLAEYLSIDMSF